MAERRQAWLTAIVTVLGVLLAAGVGLFSYIRATSQPPLHPDPQAAPSVQGATPLPRWADAVKQSQQIARAELAGQDLPGLSVAVGVDGAIVWAEGFGWANVEKRVPVAPGTRFRIGHTSKALTSAAVGLLVEKGRLNLDDEIQTYVPDFPRKKWPITLRQLMGHVAGIRHYRDTEWGDKPSARCERASEGLQSFANDPLLFQPETQYKYSTYGWILVSAAVEAAAGEPFFTFMRTKIFDPLGMSETTFDSDQARSLSSRLELGTRRPSTKKRGFTTVSRRTPVDYSCFAGAGAFLSTPSDLVRFGMAINSGKLLQPATVRMLQRPQLLASGTETEYGLGWMLDTVPLAGAPALTGESCQPDAGGRLGLVPDLSRPRARRRRDDEPLVREHEACGVADCGGLRGTRQASSRQMTR